MAKKKPKDKISYWDNTKTGKTWIAFSRLVRLTDAINTTGTTTHAMCITCGKVEEIKKMHCGHGVSRKYAYTKYNKKNNHAQCYVCNIINKGEQYLYSQKVDEMYGDGTWQEMWESKSNLTQRRPKDYEAMRDEYVLKIKELESNNGTR